MQTLLIVSGALALVAALVHGLGGELLVVRRFSPAELPASPLGGASFTGFAAVAVLSGAADTRSPRALLTHPGPAILTATAALAWWGAVSL